MTHKMREREVIMPNVEVTQQGEGYNAIFEVRCDGELRLESSSCIDALLLAWELEEEPELTMTKGEILGLSLEFYDWETNKSWRSA